MKNRSAEKAVGKAYETPKLVVYGKVSDLTQDGKGRGNKGSKGNGNKGRGGKGRGKGRGKGGGNGGGHGGSRS